MAKKGDQPEVIRSLYFPLLLSHNLHQGNLCLDHSITFPHLGL